ncbi:hypothetical protein [Kribbella sp. NPDC004536]
MTTRPTGAYTRRAAPVTSLRRIEVSGADSGRVAASGPHGGPGGPALSV